MKPSAKTHKAIIFPMPSVSGNHNFPKLLLPPLLNNSIQIPSPIKKPYSRVTIILEEKKIEKKQGDKR